MSEKTSAKKYARGVILENHSLATVYEKYGVTDELAFVKAFFGREEVAAILEECGLPPPAELAPKPEYSIRIGKSVKRADMIYEEDNSIYYFEVMSQSGGGRWDDDHHTQMYLKSTRLEQLYEDVYTFAVAFKEFDPCYLEEIQAMNNWYAIHLRFNDSGYYVDVYGAEEKRRKKDQQMVDRIELAKRWKQIARDLGFVHSSKEREGVWNINTQVGIPISKYLTKKGIVSYYEGTTKDTREAWFDWVFGTKEDRMTIKYYGHTDLDPDKIASRVQILASMPSVPRVARRKYISLVFEFDCHDFSAENGEKLASVTRAFAEAVNQAQLLNPISAV